jgi:hypothetical protein
MIHSLRLAGIVIGIAFVLGLAWVVLIGPALLILVRPH